MSGTFKHLAMLGNGILFPYTEEIMEAIVAGLEPEPHDQVLAIAGCGDQVFALLEKGAHVTAIDVNSAQVDHLRKRRDALRDDDFSGFYVPPIEPEHFAAFQRRLAYFEFDGRYERLRTNIQNLEIAAPMGIEDAVKGRSFTKIYASDAMGKLYCEKPLEDHLAQVAKGIRHGGLLYLANGPEIDNVVSHVSSLGLQRVPELSDSAKKLENYYIPNVYRRI